MKLHAVRCSSASSGSSTVSSSETSEREALALETAFNIVVENAGERFDCSPETSLLSGMEQQSKKAIAVGCRGGGCGFCKIRVISGEYEAKKMSVKFVSQEERDCGYALSCRIFPRSDMHIIAIEDINHIKKTI